MARRGVLAILRVWVIAAALGLWPHGAAAQDPETLADIRQELQFVLGEIQTLRRELSTTGGAGLPTNTGPALARIDALEAEVRRLTGEIEEKTFAIESIVKDGTNRIGDLEFRLCELESGCDVTALSRTAPLGGQGLTRPTGPAAPTVPGDEKVPETAGATDSERASFERAMAALEAQNFAAAAGQFAALTENFPGGPLTGEADYWRGVALAGAGDWSNAARAFLESFSGSPEGVKAPEALYRLGLSLNELGQREEACLMLSEVSLRYPTAAVGTQAEADFATLSCG